MYYEEEGRGEPLLLLHGALGAVDPAVTSGWFTQLPFLAARYRTFSLEHRGHGRTDKRTAWTAVRGQVFVGITSRSYIPKPGMRYTEA